MNDFVYKNDDIGGREGRGMGREDKACHARDAVYISRYVFGWGRIGKKISDRCVRKFLIPSNRPGKRTCRSNTRPAKIHNQYVYSTFDNF